MWNVYGDTFNYPLLSNQPNWRYCFNSQCGKEIHQLLTIAKSRTSLYVILFNDYQNICPLIFFQLKINQFCYAPMIHHSFFVVFTLKELPQVLHIYLWRKKCDLSDFDCGMNVGARGTGLKTLKLLITWDFHKEPSVDFTENGVKNQHTLSNSSVDRKASSPKGRAGSDESGLILKHADDGVRIWASAAWIHGPTLPCVNSLGIIYPKYRSNMVWMPQAHLSIVTDHVYRFYGHNLAYSNGYLRHHTAPCHKMLYIYTTKNQGCV